MVSSWPKDFICITLSMFLFWISNHTLHNKTHLAQFHHGHFGITIAELGHNFGLGHSGETVTYDDHSCLVSDLSFALF